MATKRPKHHRVVHHLHKRKTAAQQALAKQFPHVHQKLRSLNFDFSDLRRRGAKVISTMAIAGGLLVTTPAINATMQPTEVRRELPLSSEQLTDLLKLKLTQILPTHVGPISPEVEQQASDTIYETLGIRASAELEGNHLNTSYGYMGAEQHLPRFPGDTIDQHDELQVKGITANRGAFGYFAQSRAEMTEEKILQEKYYVAVQTLYLPNWNQEHPRLKRWYAFRKVLIINPANGKAMVAVVGDAGPAMWTGKHYGGSPEIMAHLGLNRGKQKGAVLLFFVDESEKPVALGPIEAKQAQFLAVK